MTDERRRASARPGHPRWSFALVILGAILTFAAIFSIWVNRQALNTDNWVNTSNRLIQNEEIRHRLADYLASQLFANVDVEAELEAALPPRLAPLAGPAAGGLEQLAPKAAERLFETPRFETLWENANRAAHERLLEVLNGGGSTLSTENGEVKLKLGSILNELSEGSGVGATLASKLPEDAGEITIMKSDELSLAQDVAGLVRKLPVVIALLAILCFGLAVYLAGPRRREALRSVGFAFIGAGVLAVVLRAFAGGYVVDALAKTTAAEPAVEAVWSIATALLITVATSTIVFGLLLVIAAWLAGPTRPARELRRRASPYVRRSSAGLWGVAALIFILLIAWAPVAAFRKPLGLLIFVVLFAAGTELWRRQVLEEYPEPTAAGGDPGSRRGDER
jgi:hypothetical protein